MDRYGLDKLLDMSRALLDYSERAMRELITAIPDGSYTFTDYLDDDGYGRRDLAIRLTLTIAGDAAVAGLPGQRRPGGRGRERGAPGGGRSLLLRLFNFAGGGVSHQPGLLPRL